MSSISHETTLVIKGKVTLDSEEGDRILETLAFGQPVIVTIGVGAAALGLGAIVTDRTLTIRKTDGGQHEHTKVRIQLDEGE